MDHILLCKYDETRCLIGKAAVEKYVREKLRNEISLKNNKSCFFILYKI